MTGTGLQGNRKRRPRPMPRTGEPPAAQGDELRPLCQILGLWRVCGKPACRRALACKGDAAACFQTFWRQLPEEMRVWMRAAIRARAEHLGVRAAAKAADAEVERWRALQMRYAPKAVTTECSERPAAAPETERAAAPRIRPL